MAMNYQFGDADTNGATIGPWGMALKAQHQAIVWDVLAAGDFWGGAASIACQEFITELGRNFRVIYRAANTTDVQSTGSHMADTDSAAGPSWA